MLWQPGQRHPDRVKSYVEQLSLFSWRRKGVEFSQPLLVDNRRGRSLPPERRMSMAVYKKD
jgi:hypothetical protein